MFSVHTSTSISVNTTVGAKDSVAEFLNYSNDFLFHKCMYLMRPGILSSIFKYYLNFPFKNVYTARGRGTHNYIDFFMYKYYISSIHKVKKRRLKQFENLELPCLWNSNVKPVGSCNSWGEGCVLTFISYWYLKISLNEITKQRVWSVISKKTKRVPVYQTAPGQVKMLYWLDRDYYRMVSCCPNGPKK